MRLILFLACLVGLATSVSSQAWPDSLRLTEAERARTMASAGKTSSEIVRDVPIRRGILRSLARLFEGKTAPWRKAPLLLLAVEQMESSEKPRLLKDGHVIVWGRPCRNESDCAAGWILIDARTGDVAYGFRHQTDAQGRYSAAGHLTLFVAACATMEFKAISRGFFVDSGIAPRASADIPAIEMVETACR